MHILSTNASHWSKKSNVIMIALAALLSFSACNNKTQDNNIEHNAKQYINHKEWYTAIPMTREYKIYKLHLNSIVNIKYDIYKARHKVSQTPELVDILTKDDISIHTLLPQIIKESNMNNNKTSKSWAQWYMQIMDGAIQEIDRVYDLKTISLDKDNPVDNIILWWLYRKLVCEKIQIWLLNRNIKANTQDIESLAIISYNIGITRLFEHIDRSRSENLDQLLSYFANHIGLPYDKEKQFDSTYNVSYIDIFGGEKMAKDASREKKKIYEWCRYQHIIEALDMYLEKEEKMDIITTITLDKKETLFGKIKQMKEEGIFHKDASVNDICKIVLQSNWFWENQTPTQVPLHIIYEPLQTFLH